MKKSREKEGLREGEENKRVWSEEKQGKKKK